MVFDSQGKYIRSIGKVGQGSEEYPWLIYDAVIDTGKSVFFKQTVEGIGLRPELIAEDYMLMLMPTEELEKLLSLVGEEEQAKILRRVEDDNPCLVKFLF